MPVLLVHGILGQPMLYWNVLRRRLERAGLRVREVALPHGLLGDLRDAAKVLADDVEKAVAEEGGPVDIVCHSAGGLVVRHHLQRLGGRHVRHVVFLGVPHHGTMVSRLLPLPLEVRVQTVPGSRFLGDLAAAPWPDVRLTNLWSPWDGIVVPARNAELEGAHNVPVRWTHHWGLLVSRQAHEEILAALIEDPS